MSLDPQIAGLLAMMADQPALDYTKITPETLREAMDRPLPAENLPPIASVKDITLPLEGRSIPARLYMPLGSEEAAPPLTLYYHGGGWVIGTIETHDATCRALCAASGSAILSVGYRLAPEHPFPAPLDDCTDAAIYAAEHGADWGVDSSRMAVAGDSAGGNLSAAVALRLRDAGGPALRHQLLLYPVADRDYSRDSYVKFGTGEYFLSTEGMRFFWDSYLPEGQDCGGFAKIIDAKDVSNLPSTTLLTAAFDPLCDEGLAYGEKLKNAGNVIEVHNVPGMVHGFFSMFPFSIEAQKWVERAGQRLRDALA